MATAALRRIKKNEAAEMLGVGVRHLERMRAAGIFTAIKEGSAALFMSDEIETYIVEEARGQGRGSAAVQELRKKNGRLKK